MIWGILVFGTNELVRAVKHTRDLNVWNQEMRANYERVYGPELFKWLWLRHADFSDWIFVEGGKWDIRDELRKVRCPVLVLHGDRDPLIHYRHVQTVLDAVPESQVYRYPNGSHNIHQAFAADFNKRVTDFLLESSPL